MLYLETSGAFSRWAGEAIDGVRHPRSIESRWTAEELATIGLYAPAEADPVPEGKISTGQTVQRVDGVVKFVHTLADAPPPSLNLQPLAPWQFWAMLRITGKEQAVKDFVAVLPQPQKAVAESQLEFSLEFRRDHPMVESVRAVLGMTGAELDTLWDQGHQLAL